MKHIIFIFVIGALASLSMAPTSFPPAILLGLAILYQKLENSTSCKRSAVLGFTFSLGYFGFSLSWIGNALLVEGNPYWWAWPLAISGLPIILSCFTAAATATHFYIKKHTTKIISTASFVILITASEIARGHLFTGFPWNLYGYTWIKTMPIAQVASLHNIYLLSALTIFWAALLGFCASCKIDKIQKTISLIIILSSFSVAYVFGTNKIQNYKPIKTDTDIIIVQPNIKQSEKWDNTKRPKHFASLIELSRNKTNANKKNHLIIWPETAIAQDILNAPWATNMIKEMLNSYPNDAYLITGALRNERNSHFNSIVTFNGDAEIVNIYDKSHLVPFGEYMPLSNIIDISPIVGFSGFEKGNKVKKMKINEQISFTPKICYEIIFPDTENHYTDFIINVTNDAWYGNSTGPYQHLVQTQFRAIEQRKTVLRSANTGISAIINPLGYITKKQNLLEGGVIREDEKRLNKVIE